MRISVLGISLKPRHLKRYGDIARLLMKHGRGDLVRSSGLGGGLLPTEEESAGGKAEDLAEDLERLGPTFVKLGQLLSTRADLLPPEYLSALSRLQDDVEPFDGAEAEAIVAEELGVKVSTAFSRFDRVPVAAASLGQVHYAELRDGRPVAVKVQRPHIRESMATDIESLREIAGLLERHSGIGARFDLVGMIGEFEKSLSEELDYLKEASNLQQLELSLSRFDRLVVPRPIPDYTTARVLTMQYVSGRKISELGPMTRMEMDGPELASQLFEAYLQQILVDGLFHADPHPGNLLLTQDRRIAFLDLGMVGRATPRMQEKLLGLLLAISEGQGEKVAEIAVSISEVAPDADLHGFERAVVDLVSTHRDSTVEHVNVGRVVVSTTGAAGRFGIRLPANLTLLGKTLLNLDEVARTLDPEFDPNAAVREHATGVLRRRMLKQVSPGQAFSTFLEVSQLFQRLPAQLNTALERFTNNELEFRVRAFDEIRLLDGLQKIANRIASGLVLAALIIGAAMLMSVDTDFTVLGYPGLAMALFVAAVAGGVAMLINILRNDETPEKPSHKVRR
jgi:predicted unusual protein kinase regulating ubiquinone biosynthesis (AarF/ABC1/UbiB family)